MVWFSLQYFAKVVFSICMLVFLTLAHNVLELNVLTEIKESAHAVFNAQLYGPFMVVTHEHEHNLQKNDHGNRNEPGL